MHSAYLTETQACINATLDWGGGIALVTPSALPLHPSLVIHPLGIYFCPVYNLGIKCSELL